MNTQIGLDYDLTDLIAKIGLDYDLTDLIAKTRAYPLLLPDLFLLFDLCSCSGHELRRGRRWWDLAFNLPPLLPQIGRV
jgi:hypothetical protein